MARLLRNLVTLVMQVAGDKCPIVLTVQAILLRWPDTTSGLRFVTGSTVASSLACVENWRLTRQCWAVKMLLPQRSNLSSIERMQHHVRPGDHDEDLPRMTKEEVEQQIFWWHFFQAAG